MFTPDEALLHAVRERLLPLDTLRFVMGGAGTGKSAVCSELRARTGIRVLDMDALLYGSWHGSFDPLRHPANHAWATAADPLAWQLGLAPPDFLAFHDASTVEALDLLARERDLAEPANGVALVDGGLGSVATLARAVPAARIVCLAVPPGVAATVWSGPDRRPFLDVVAGVEGVTDPVPRFLALDAALSARMVSDARAAGVPVIERETGEPVSRTADSVARVLGLDGRGPA